MKKQVEFFDLVNACFLTHWFKNFKREYSAGFQNTSKNEDAVWGAYVYVGRRVSRLLKRSLSLVERTQIMDQCICALEVTGRLQVFSSFRTGCGGIDE
jgi:hypothetical protein